MDCHTISISHYSETPTIAGINSVETTGVIAGVATSIEPNGNAGATVGIMSMPRLGRPALKRSLSLKDRLNHIAESRKEGKLESLLVAIGLVVVITCFISFIAAFFVVEMIKSRSDFRLRSDDSNQNILMDI